MQGIKRILCPVDTSPLSRRALQYAMAVGWWSDARVTVLSVRPVIPPPALWLDYPARLPFNPFPTRESEEARVRTFVRETAGEAVTDVVVCDGTPVAEILRMSKTLPADLIVMGTHGLSGFEHWLLGSVTEKVLRKAPCPVLTVPQSALESDPLPAVAFRTIVCAVDFSADAQQVVDRAVSLAREARGRVVLVHVLEQFSGEGTTLTTHFDVAEFRRAFESDARTRLETMVPASARGGLELEVVVAHGNAARELLRVAGAYEGDVIVVGVHGRNALDLALFGSTTQRVLQSGRLPVLTIPRATRTASAAA